MDPIILLIWSLLLTNDTNEEGVAEEQMVSDKKARLEKMLKVIVLICRPKFNLGCDFSFSEDNQSFCSFFLLNSYMFSLKKRLQIILGWWSNFRSSLSSFISIWCIHPNFRARWWRYPWSGFWGRRWGPGLLQEVLHATSQSETSSGWISIISME